MAIYNVTNEDIEKFLSTITSGADEWYGSERYMTGNSIIKLLEYIGYRQLEKLKEVALSKD